MKLRLTPNRMRYTGGHGPWAIKLCRSLVLPGWVNGSFRWLDGEHFAHLSVPQIIAKLRRLIGVLK